MGELNVSINSIFPRQALHIWPHSCNMHLCAQGRFVPEINSSYSCNDSQMPGIPICFEGQNRRLCAQGRFVPEINSSYSCNDSQMPGIPICFEGQNRRLLRPSQTPFFPPLQAVSTPTPSPPHPPPPANMIKPGCNIDNQYLQVSFPRIQAHGNIR